MGRELVEILYVNTSHPYHKPVDIRGGRGHWTPGGSRKTFPNNVFEKNYDMNVGGT